MRCYPTDARNRNQSLDGVTKGRKHLLDARIEGGDAPLQFLNQAEVMVDQEAMMRGHAAIDRSGQVGAGTLQTGRSEFGQPHRVRLAGNHRLQDAAAAHAHDVRDHRNELDVGVLQRLLNTLNVLRNLADQLRPCACQVAQLLNRGWWHRARPDQPVRQKGRRSTRRR